MSEKTDTSLHPLLFDLVWSAQVITICGWDIGFKHGKCLGESQLSYPYAICIDPIHPLHFWVGDMSSIRYVNTETDTVSLIAGADVAGCVNGVGGAARFDVIYDLICTRAGDRLYAADYNNNCIRSVDLGTKLVTRIGGTGSIHRPRKLAFDRSRAVPVTPDSVVYVTAHDGLYRLLCQTGKLEACEWKKQKVVRRLDLRGLVCTTSGHVVMSCLNTNSIYLFDPPTGVHTLLAGSGVAGFDYTNGSGKEARFSFPYALALVEHEQCLYVSDAANGCIRRMTLPPSLFVV